MQTFHALLQPLHDGQFVGRKLVVSIIHVECNHRRVDDDVGTHDVALFDANRADQRQTNDKDDNDDGIDDGNIRAQSN